MKIQLEIYDQRLEEIIDKEAELETLASGFRFLEGPAWHPVRNTLLFSDIMGNGLYCWNEKAGITLFRGNSYLANGNTYDPDGHLLTCEHGTSRVTRTRENGDYEVLASHYQGQELNSPNDIIAKRDGSIYFTDPNPGRCTRVGIPREMELPFQGVYRVDPIDRSVTLLVDDFSKPNGLCFSLDEKHLFINDSDRQHIRVFEVQNDGSLANGRLWAELRGAGCDPGVADGMKCDARGNLYCSGPGGVHIFDSQGTCLGRILTPEVAANFTWGDNDLCCLFLTATTSLYRLRMHVPGFNILQQE